MNPLHDTIGDPLKQKRKERIDRGIKVRANDIFAPTSYREMLYVSVPPAIPVVLLVTLPLILSPYWQKVFVTTMIFALLAMSWDFLACVGMISLGQALFFGIGAYLTGCLDRYAGLPIWLTIPLATILGGGLCTALLFPVLRLRGIYFAMVTLVLPIMLERCIEATGLLGGTEGLTGLKAFPNQWVRIYVVVAAVLLVLFGFRRLLTTTNYGVVLRSIRDNDRAVMSSGHNIYSAKAFALFVAGCTSAFAGAYMTHVYRFVGMPAFALDYSILPIAAAALGGMETFFGSFLGSLILIPLSEALRGFGGLRMVFYCLAMVFFIEALPEGVFHFIRRKYNQTERWVEVEK